jgi:large subunit ribosomal protein L30
MAEAKKEAVVKRAKAQTGAESKVGATTVAKATIRIQYFRSKIQAPVKHKRVIKGLGFTRLNQVVVREDTPSIRGMVKTVPHLVRIVD